MTTPFHLAFPVLEIESTRRFYVDLLGCRVGRMSERWIDFNLGGNQISAHVVENGEGLCTTNEVDGDVVPVRHFGLVLPWEDWHALAERLKEAQVPFVIEPRIRFAGQVGEQATMFLRDPSGNALEFKSFQNPGRLFASD